MQHGLQRLVGIAIKGDAAAKPPAREIQTLSISPAIRMTVVCNIAMT